MLREKELRASLEINRERELLAKLQLARYSPSAEARRLAEADVYGAFLDVVPEIGLYKALEIVLGWTRAATYVDMIEELLESRADARALQ